MAGVKGKSGSGGVRTGAGRKKTLKVVEKQLETVESPDNPAEETGTNRDSLEFLLDKMVDPAVDMSLRVRAAIAAAQYQHLKKGDGGIKDGKNSAAKKVANGRFTPGAPPKLVVNNSK